MLIDTLTSRIELLQEQITDLEQSGFYTEKEMDSKTIVLRKMEAALTKKLNILSAKLAKISWPDTGFSACEINEAAKVFMNLWYKIDGGRKLDYPILDIQVIDAEILTPNNPA